MRISENFRKKNQKKREVYLIWFIVGIILLIVTPILVNQVLPGIYNLFAKPKYLEIQIPDHNKMEKKSKPDSVLSAYLLSHDSVVLQYETESKITDLKNIDSFLNKKNFKILLIKPSPKTGYNSLVTILDKIGKANIRHYAIVDFNKNEFDSVVREKK